MIGPTRGNVPVHPGALVGRDQLLEAVFADVRSGRLVSLTGVGGVGKTRLATEVAATVADEFPDGVWLVALESVVDPAAVPDAVATTLGIARHGETSMTETVAGTIADRGLLLVLDNCEHVLDAAAKFVGALLARPGTVKILTTSRVSLPLADERAGQREVPVTPLALDGGSSSPAVTLFAARAREVRPNFALEDGPATAQAAVEICRVLDGIPLGIELAAARMAGMGVIDVRDRLDDRFRLLEGAPDAPRRQRSLQELVRWSVELLEPAERVVLEQASVFTAGFDLAAYAGVFDVADDVEVLRSLDRLVRSSLVVADHAHGRVRYRLLETIRQHGFEALERASLLDAARDGHARYYAAETATRWEHWNGPGWRSTVDWLTLELPNLRSAFQWSSERDQLEVATDIAAHAALIGTSAHQFEPIGWVERLLERASIADIARLPRLYAAAGYACFVGRPATAVANADRAMALEAQPGYDPCEPGLSLFIGALANVYAGNLDRYVELASAAAELPGDARAFALPALVDGLQASGRVDDALELLDVAVAAARDVGSPFWLVYSLWIAGITLSKTDPARALSVWDEGLEVVDQDRVDFFRGFLARDAARLHTLGDADVALSLFESAIDAFQHAGNVAQLIITLASVPALFESLGRREAAATLHAAVTRLPASTDHVSELPALGDRLAADLGAAIAAPNAAGRSMDLDQAATYARTQIALVRKERARQSSEGPPGGLTRRELEILRLVADGLTTREIADRLFISAKTADRHIQNLYTKIGTSTRATATRWAMEHGVVSSTAVDRAGPS